MKYQFMPMFWGDFLANTMHLTAQEAGAYLFLIAHAWEHDGNIPVKDLQRVARVSNNHWYQVRARLEPFFTPTTGVTGDPHHGGTFWTHERVAQELTRATEISNKRKEAALQMHSKSTSKSSANALQTPPHTTLQLPIEKLSNGKGSEPPPAQVQGNYRDPGIDYPCPTHHQIRPRVGPTSRQTTSSAAGSKAGHRQETRRSFHGRNLTPFLSGPKMSDIPRARARHVSPTHG